MMLGYNKDVEAILPLIPIGSTGIEIGVGRGDTSARFLTRAKWMHLVDPWSLKAYEEQLEFGGIDAYLAHYAPHLGTQDPVKVQERFDAMYGAVSKRFVGANVAIHRCRSKDFFSDFNARVDWVYVDGSHTAKSVQEDLEGAARVADVIFGDDYNSGNPGVREAVQVFKDKSGMTLDLFGRQQFRFSRPC